MMDSKKSDDQYTKELEELEESAMGAFSVRGDHFDQDKVLKRDKALKELIGNEAQAGSLEN